MAPLNSIGNVQLVRNDGSNVTDAVQDEVRAWQCRPLEALYPILYLDCIHVAGGAGGAGAPVLAVAPPGPAGADLQKKTLRASEQDLDDVRAKREAWRSGQPSLDPARLVFVDETGLDTKMVRRHGRGPRGGRVHGSAPQGHWRTTTFVAALRRGGLSAPVVVEGAVDGAGFLAYVREFLCPTLSPGDIVVWDNLSSHPVAGVRGAVEAAGATLMPLPPYSPDFNPIERVFAKLKTLLRKAGERTVEALWNTLARLLEEFSPEECANYLRGAGYAVQAN